MTSFPQAFSDSFAQRTKGEAPLEIPLFRTLQATIQGLSTQFYIEEIHGAKSQVEFTPTDAWRPGAGRCELADLMILTFQTPPNELLRLAFLQMKSERSEVIPPFWRTQPGFWASYEQWDLLSNRPPISPRGSAQPPGNVLSDAILPSVGSFGFFYKDKSGDYQVCYSIADNLARTTKTPRHYGRVELMQPPHVRTVSGYDESAAAYSSIDFASDLEAGLIGTPIETTTSVDEAYRSAIRQWVRSVLRGALALGGRHRDDSIAQHLLRSLGDDQGDGDPTPAPTSSLVLIETRGGKVSRRGDDSVV